MMNRETYLVVFDNADQQSDSQLTGLTDDKSARQDAPRRMQVFSWCESEAILELACVALKREGEWRICNPTVMCM